MGDSRSKCHELELEGKLQDSNSKPEVMIEEEKNFYEVGYSYFYSGPETNRTCFTVYGTEAQAKKFIKGELKKAPEWLRNQVKDFDSNNRTQLFVLKLNVIKL